MPYIYVPEPCNDNHRAALDWWLAMAPDTRMVFLQALWEIEGCETPEQLEPHQRKKTPGKQKRSGPGRGQRKFREQFGEREP